MSPKVLPLAVTVMPGPQILSAPLAKVFTSIVFILLILSG